MNPKNTFGTILLLPPPTKKNFASTMAPGPEFKRKSPAAVSLKLPVCPLIFIADGSSHCPS